MFLLSGVALLAITYFLVARRPTGNTLVLTTNDDLFAHGIPSIPPLGLRPEDIRSQVDRQTAAVLHQLLVQSIVALVIMAVASVVLGWFVAGRALRPLRSIATAAAEVSSTSLDRRLRIDGPDDELRQLASTFNGLLERLERSFDAQRQFVANASHELRTPLTVTRTTLEVALADPGATSATLRDACAKALASGEQQERLIEALLTLARSERGIDHREAIDLATTTERVIDARADDLARHHLVLQPSLEPAPIGGDEQLVERLVGNLVANAIVHNRPGGTISITTRAAEGRSSLEVSNDGHPVPLAEVDRLLLPFQRAAGSRADHSGGLGLGLSIVRAIADAHGATVAVVPREAGGLTVTATFPTLGPTR